ARWADVHVVAVVGARRRPHDLRPQPKDDENAPPQRLGLVAEAERELEHVDRALAPPADPLDVVAAPEQREAEAAVRERARFLPPPGTEGKGGPARRAPVVPPAGHACAPASTAAATPRPSRTPKAIVQATPIGSAPARRATIRGARSRTPNSLET